MLTADVRTNGAVQNHRRPATITVKKRNGEVVPFDEKRVREALYACFTKDMDYGPDRARLAAESVTRQVYHLLVFEETPIGVERIQDLVEQQLMAAGHHDAAKQYILFREHKRQAREAEAIPAEVTQAFQENERYLDTAIQRFQALDKFARYRHDLKRRETWPETVHRVLNFFRKHCQESDYSVSETTWQQLSSSLLNRLASPSMRCVQMAGPALERCHVGVYNCLGAETAFVTSKGVRTFNDFQDGDEVTVLSHSGKWRSAVVRCYGIQKLNQYTFTRGRTQLTVRATENHRWLLDSPMHETWRAKKSKVEAEVSLGRSLSLLEPEQAEHGFWETTELQIGDRLSKAPFPFESWNYEDADPLEKLYWAYGYVYGDGTLTRNGQGDTYSMVRLCGAETGRYLQRFKELGFKSSLPLSCEGDAMVYTGKYAKTLPSIASDGVSIVRAFVRGLLDADGTKNNQGSGRNQFASIQATGEEAINFIREVFPSVGVYILREDELTGQVTNLGTRHRQTVRFGLLTAVGDLHNGFYSCTATEEDREEPVWCLEVEEDHSFVLANGLLTGNCAFQFIQDTQDLAEELYILMQGTGAGFSVERRYAVEKFPRVKRQDPKQEVETYVVEDNTEGWCRAYKYGMDTWIDGRDVKYDFSQVRPENTPLKTKGGRASGPGPLRDLLEFARTQVLKRQGRTLSSLDIHDINCYAHRIVKMGGVRRASGISISDLDDHEMRDCKRGEFWNHNEQRNQANNSAAYEEKPDQVTWMEEWLMLAKSGSGERGIFNRGSLAQQFPARRNSTDHLFGTNPCVSADTWVHTDEGPKRVSDLLDAPFTALVDGQAHRATAFWQTGVKQLYRVKVANGMSLRLTAHHKVLVVSHQTRKVQRTEWRPLKDVRPGDAIVLHNHRGAIWTGAGTYSEGQLLGSLVGDGCFGSQDQAHLDFWGEDREEMREWAVETVHAAVGARSDCCGTTQSSNVGKVRVQSANLGRLADSYGIDRDKHLGDRVEQTSSDFHAGFFRRWFDADGSVQGTQQKGVSVRLAHSNLANLRVAQRMLARLGVNSVVYPERRPEGFRELPDGQGGTKEYWCNADHELVIANDNLFAFRDFIGFGSSIKANDLDDRLSDYRRKPNRDRFAEAVVSIEPDGVEPVYDCTVEGPHAFDANGLYVHNCGEIVLRHKQFCNLSIAVIRPEDSLKVIREKVVIATIWGTLQSTMTKFNFIGDTWRENSEEERLLGVDLLGFLDHPLFQDNEQAGEICEELKQLVIDTNRQWAQHLGINPSAATTCIKPSGDSSLFFGTAAGFKGHHGQYYVRRTRSTPQNPVARMLIDAGVPWHTDYDKTGIVLEFPIKAPETAVLLENQTALSQLKKWKTFKQHWTEHNPSVTIYVRPDEWLEVGKWVYDNWELIGGLSFMPYDGGVYHLAPYEQIDQEEYNKRIESFPDINWAKLVRYETEDMTDLHQQVACTGGACEL